jgi:hypothetical protein
MEEDGKDMERKRERESKRIERKTMKLTDNELLRWKTGKKMGRKTGAERYREKDGKTEGGIRVFPSITGHP